MSDTTKQPLRRGQDNKKTTKTKTNNGKKSKFNWNWKTWKTRNKVFSIIFLLLLIASIFFFFIPNHKAKQPLSFMIVGVDSDAYREEEYSQRKPHRTDAIMVATFNPKTYNVEMTSIPRDTAVDYACEVQDMGYKVRGPINDVYEASGRDINCLKKTVSNFLNVPINYYALIDMSQLEEIIDNIGGISLQVHAQDGSFCQVTTDVSKKYCFKDGEVEEMDGEEAVVYSRFRKDSEKDYGRGRRQQQVISAMISKITTEKKFNQATITSLLSMVSTDVDPVVLANYYTYFKNMSSVGKMVEGQQSPTKRVLPTKAWERIFEKVGINNPVVSNETVTQAINSAKANPEYVASPLQLFFTNHQFVNDTYAGFYVTPDEQRYEISNALRKNLGLKEETPKDYENEFGRPTLLTDEEAYFGEENWDHLPDENASEQPVQQQEQTPVNNKPIITGPDQYTINVGEEFVPNLSATDKEDGAVSVYVVNSNLNNQIPGNYQIAYQAKDKDGNVSDIYIVYVTVVGNQNQESISASEVVTDDQGRTIYKDASGVCWIVTDQSGSGFYHKVQKLEVCPIG